jgi:hypothetical protein
MQSGSDDMRITLASGGVPSSLTVPVMVLAPIGAGGGSAGAGAAGAPPSGWEGEPPAQALTATVNVTNAIRTRTHLNIQLSGEI